MLITRTVMAFGSSCRWDRGKHSCVSQWNSSSFHIAVSHGTDVNEMSAWMPVVQALTQYPIIDWVSLQSLMHMRRTCFAKLVVGQTAALHLYNDHRLPPPPSVYPHPELNLAGL
jgi:hypothetical protein